ncbi:MAG: DUF167 domain-containing protein [Microgenomates group bacterium]
MKIQIIVKTKAREAKVVQLTDSVYEVHVTAPQIEGKANLAVIDALVDHFHLHKNQVQIVSRFKSINKVIELSGL